MKKVHFIYRKLDTNAEMMDNLVNDFIEDEKFDRVLEDVKLSNDYIIVLYKEL